MFVFSVYAINFLSNDCIKSSKLYNETFGFKIINLSINHSELELNPNVKLIFSKNSENCKVDVGSLTISIEKIEIDFLKSKLKQFQFESFYKEKKYASFLDSYGNRIWFYEFKN